MDLIKWIYCQFVQKTSTSTASRSSFNQQSSQWSIKKANVLHISRQFVNLRWFFSLKRKFKGKCHKYKGWKRQSCQLLVSLISCEKSSAIISTVGRRLSLPQAWLCYGLRLETQTFTICWRQSRVSVVLRGAFLLKELQLSSTETCFSSSEEQWAH